MGDTDTGLIKIYKCAFCGDDALDSEFDRESGLWIHAWCLDQWWDDCEPLPAPIVIMCRNGPDVIIGQRGFLDVWNTEDAPEHLRKRGVLT